MGSTIGSFTLYSVYATVAHKIQEKLTFIATKMDFILGCITGVVGIGNVIYFLFRG
ncbi:hypothetical protein [Bizionia echini]|uniref:hypothetical protein n=1 Tax=Bizionia echini TaxID=649333 RepID=UPI0030D77231